MLWLLKNWDVVLSDFSVFHRMSRVDAEALPADELFDRAMLLLFYTGAVQATAVRAFRREEAAAPRAVQGQRTDVVPTDPTAEQVRAMRDEARRRKFGAKYGEHKHVSLDEFMGVASGG